MRCHPRSFCGAPERISQRVVANHSNHFCSFGPYGFAAGRSIPSHHLWALVRGTSPPARCSCRPPQLHRWRSAFWSSSRGRRGPSACRTYETCSLAALSPTPRPSATRCTPWWVYAIVRSGRGSRGAATDPLRRRRASVLPPTSWLAMSPSPSRCSAPRSSRWAASRTRWGLGPTCGWTGMSSWTSCG
jgi:hypothetical protein